MGTYALEEITNKWKHHLNEGKVIQTNQQLNQYFENQTKLQKNSHYNWIGSLQQVHLVIRNQESIAGLMSSISLIVSIILQNRFLVHVDGIKQHSVETIFKDCESLTHYSLWKEFNCHVDNKLFSHHCKLFILKMNETCH